MTPRTRPPTDGAGLEIAVVDSRPLFGAAMAAVFQSAGLRVRVVRPEAVRQLVAHPGVALVARAVPDFAATVTELTRHGCRVIVYGVLDRSALGIAARAGAVDFVPEDGAALDFERAVEAAVGSIGLPAFSGGAPGASPRPFDHIGFADLTRREREVLDGLVAGLRPADIARRDFVSVVTVRNQVQSLLTKLNVHSQLEAVAAARWYGWGGPPTHSEVDPAIDASAS
ncbi:MAG: response regulator transcription factor [Acidimicrobiia bacterium]|nr:response regulator transcription factor [Acidimicrobiia bacterium]